MKNAIIILLFLSLIFSKEKEQLFYTVYYNGINTGSARLEFTDDKINSNFANIKFNLKSKKIIDFVYKIREETSLIINKIDYSIKEIKKKSRQGRKKKQFTALFNYDEKEGYINNKKIDVKKSIYDPISIIYHLRNEKMYINQNFTYNIISKNKIKLIEMKVLGEETLIQNNTEYDCFILGPNSLDKKGSKLNNIDDIKIWINKENTHLPIIIEKKATHGIIKMELESIQIINE
jgi:hypothetical protein